MYTLLLILLVAVSGKHPRVLPDHVRAVINEQSWQWPAIFKWLQQNGNVDTHEMYRTFNCGVGMVIALPQEDVETALALLAQTGEKRGLSGKLNILMNKTKNR